MDYIKGRGAQINPKNPFSNLTVVNEHPEGKDETMDKKPHTQFFTENPKEIVNKIDSPDLGMNYSINPYQGCEHGCAYCYARNVHQYWGYSAGVEFESKIIVKKNAPYLLEKFLQKKTWQPTTISLSGNTDCYQPAEKKYQLTRRMLQIFLKYGNPVAIISKNSLILRDLDILKKLAAENLVHVMISVTTLDEQLRSIMEPRTATGLKRLQVIQQLTENRIPTGVMTAPIIPGLNSHEIPELLRRTSAAGACKAAYTVVRLNGSVKELFHDWLWKNFPDRASKVWHQIEDLHGGQVNDSQWGRRIKGEGKIANTISQLFNSAYKKYYADKPVPPLDKTRFRRNGNLNLF